MIAPWILLLAQAPTAPVPMQAPPAAAPPAAAPLLAAPAPMPLLRAQYAWGYAGTDGQGKGTLSVLLEPATGRTVLELQGLGERLMLLEGSPREGFRIQVPRRQLDQRASTLAGLPVPFFPQMGTPMGLYRLMTEGEGPGVKVTRRDKAGPVKLKYQGVDDQGREVMVWLTRTRWEPEVQVR